MGLDSIITILMFALSLCVVVFGAWKMAQVKQVFATVKAQEDTISAQTVRLALYESDTAALRCRVEKLENVVESKETALRLFVTAAAEAGLCLNAPTCERRALPVSS